MAPAEQPAAERPRAMRADAQRNHERIVAVAREVFAEHGPEAPLDDIARRAGVGAGTLYRHFPNRECLIEAVYRGEIEGLSDRAHELLAECPPEEALMQWMRDHVGVTLQRRGLAMTLKQAIDKDSETFALCKTTMRDAAAALLKPAQEAGRVRADVRPGDLLRLCHALGVAAESVPEDADWFLSLLFGGLRVPVEEGPAGRPASDD